jgi:hypothetical protein
MFNSVIKSRGMGQVEYIAPHIETENWNEIIILIFEGLG